MLGANMCSDRVAHISLKLRKAATKSGVMWAQVFALPRAVRGLTLLLVWVRVVISVFAGIYAASSLNLSPTVTL
jgi:hypothetical protein